LWVGAGGDGGGWAARAEPTSTDINEAWLALVTATSTWVNDHMDQWEKFKFDTRHGPIFVTISYASDHPNDFDLVDRETGDCIRQAGVPNRG